MEKRRDQNTRDEPKTRLVAQINICLSSGGYSRALDLLRGAAAEFPHDAEFAELEKLAQEGVQRNAEANRLITESQELFAQLKFAEAIQLLRQAYELDKHNSLARTILANALVEHAHSIVETDWWEAETLTNEALALNPAHPTAKTIYSLILDRKTAGSVEAWVAQTRKLQSSGNLSAALSQIAEAFAIYPLEPRLLQVQDAIQRDHSTQRRQARRRDLEDLRRMESEIDSVADIGSKKALTERIQAMTVKHATDGEILSLANGLLRRLELREVVRRKSPAASPDSEGATRIDHAPSPEVPRAPTSQTLPHQISPNQISPNQIPPGNGPAAIVPPSIVLPSKVPPPEPVPMLPAPQAVPMLAAEPSPPAARVASRPSSPLRQQEQPARSNSTKLILFSAAAVIMVAAVVFFARQHHAPLITNAPADAPAVSAPGVPTPAPTTPVPSAPALPLSSDSSAGKASLDDQAHAVPAPPPSTFIESGHNESGHNLGTLLVVAGQDNARVFLNGKPQPLLTQAGQLRLPNIELKDYVVQVAKSGFQDPPPQQIRMRKGEQARLVFNLQPQNLQPNLQPSVQPQHRLASLTIQGGAPGTTVLVDQSVVGTIQSDGTLSVSSVNPGDHTVELRKERFRPRQFKKQFVVGGVISLAAVDAALEAAPSELKITFAPADANVAIAKAGGLPTIVSSGVPLNLAAGTYTLTARTAERFTRSSTLEVVAGQSKALDLSLAPNGMSKWDDPGGWKQERDSFIRKGGNFVLYRVVPASGTFAFSAMLTKGHILQWVLNYTDPKNYVLFQMDDKNFYRTVIRNGEKADEIIVPDKGDKKSFRTLHIRVSPTEIVHQIQHGNSWKVLDRWTQPGANLSLGKFGFHIPGNDEVSVSNFAHYADLNLR